MQHSVLVLIREMLVLDDLLDLMLAVVVIHFMGKVAGEHKRLVADSFNQMVQRLLGSLAANEDPSRFDVPANVGTNGLALIELDVLFTRIVLDMSLPPAVESFQDRSGAKKPRLP